MKLYQHWLFTLTMQWGSDIDTLIQELQHEQQKLQSLYDLASLQVRRAGEKDFRSMSCRVYTNDKF